MDYKESLIKTFKLLNDKEQTEIVACFKKFKDTGKVEINESQAFLKLIILHYSIISLADEIMKTFEVQE